MVANVPTELAILYEEARASTAAGAHTAAVLVCRKMLMNIAVALGDTPEPGKTFVKYIQYLKDHGYIPPKGDQWVDYIRKRGNEATHEIALMQQSDAETLITFVGMLLRIVYEFPAAVPSPAPMP